jgi:CRISPR/Cas system CSM-associated protein Csm3 (group 7 of RAMP superfamily)
MVKVRIVYKVTFETLSELHVGSGLATSEQFDKDSETEVARIVLDVRGKPWIPGSTLKGAFRAQSDVQDLRLFGKPHAKGAEFARGDLTFSGLSLDSNRQVEPKVRTAVDPGTGASAARKLFAQDYVAIGSRFTGDIVLECSEERLRDAKAAFMRSLNRFSRAEGVAIGSGKADGLGRMRLIEVDSLVQKLGPSGWSAATKESVNRTPDKDEDWISIELECPGPYLVFGKKGKVLDADGEEREVTFAERTGKLPRLFPTGVAGALRARALWLAECAALQKGTPLETMALSVKTSAGDADLTVVQRLCGDEGYRASMAMKVEMVDSKQPLQTDHPAGPLDPVLQTPRTGSGSVHRRNADSGVRIRLSLRLWRATATEDEQQLFAALLEDIRQNGLPLGLGTPKGFGWFGINHVTEPSLRNPARGLNNDSPPDRTAKLPKAEITLPYRQVEVDPNTVGFPEPSVAAAHKARELHSKPFPDGLSGWVDVSWCFETPMLVGDTIKIPSDIPLEGGGVAPRGKLLRKPQTINRQPVIPGTTLRGMIRSLIEIATSARLGPHQLNPYDFPPPEKRKRNDKRKDFPLRGAVAYLHASDKHNAVFDRNFSPDFAQALLGFISPETGELDPDEHSALHLKSRVSFGWAFEKSGRDEAKSKRVYRALLSSPDPTSVFMDHVGRRVYPVTKDTSEDVIDRIARSADKGSDGMPSYLWMLHPKDEQCLVFRGRIRFHNVTKVELGALMWAITLGMGPGMRHSMGTARNYGAGRCFAADLHMKVERNDGKDVSRTETADARHFGPDGTLAQTFVDAFTAWLDANGLRKHSFRERLAASDPAYGEALRKGIRDFAYQTNEGLKRELRDEDRKKRDAIARANGGGLPNKGRLAAMMKR